MSQLIFELSRPNRRGVVYPKTLDKYKLSEKHTRTQKAKLPEVAEIDFVRHYVNLSRTAYGVDNGFYPLGSCTMKYNPKFNNEISSWFNNLHPYQDTKDVKGALKVITSLEDSLKEITGMDAVSLQPAAGAQGEFTSLLMIRSYHEERKDHKRTKVLVPDSAHGTNPASVTMAGYKSVILPSDDKGGVDVEELKKLMTDEVAALMLTNPNTLGLFDSNIVEITKIVHDNGGLVYYDGANMNAIMGKCRPKDMGFDIVHLNLHKTFSTPHGGGGPGSGPIGCVDILTPYLPKPTIKNLEFNYELPSSIGKIKSFYGNFGVYVKALAYIMILGKDGLTKTSENAVLNANYMMHKLKDTYDIPFFDQGCMHEFVLSLSSFKEKYGVNAKDISKAMLDYNIHPPTMYFPLIVPEALMIEPTETESKETLDKAIAVLLEIAETAKNNPQAIHDSPTKTLVRRVDETEAARNPILRYKFTD